MKIRLEGTKAEIEYVLGWWTQPGDIGSSYTLKSASKFYPNRNFINQGDETERVYLEVELDKT